MAYLVLARKWRPTVFDDVVGQHHITQTLRNAIELSRVPHALLFSGSRGIGKTSCARILAKALNCEHGPTPNPCGRCNACLEIASGRSIDVFEIDGASNNSVEQIREIRESVKFVPSGGRRKIYIIDEVHMLSVSAFNALLKTLEEPPEHVIFVFATTEPHKLPDTIISRCQRFDFRRIPSGQLVSALAKIATSESVQIADDVLADIAREARGGMRDSLSLLDQVISFCGTQVASEEARQVLGIAGRSQLASMFQALTTRRGESVLELLEAQHQKGADLEKYAHRFIDFVRDLLVVRICQNPARILDQEADEIQRMQALVQRLQPADLHRILGCLLRHVDELNHSAFPKLRLEMALLEICEQGTTIPIAELMDALDRLELPVVDGDKKKTSAAKGPKASKPVTTTSVSDSAPDLPSGLGNSTPKISQGTQATSTPMSIESVKAGHHASSDAVTEDDQSTHSESSDVKMPTPVEAQSKAPKPSINGEQKTASGGSFKKRPSQRSGGYDDFSATPPKPWTPDECPTLTVKARLFPNSLPVETTSAPSVHATKVDLVHLCTLEDTALGRYQVLLGHVRAGDTFLASDLEQNSYIVSFDENKIEIAVELSAAELVSRATLAFGQILELATPVDEAVIWHRCDREDVLLAQKSLYDIRREHAAAVLAERKKIAEDHESVRLTKEILGGQVIEVVPLKNEG